MSTLDVLKAARELISDPARWTQGYWARDAEGDGCEPNRMRAVCWCAAGAVNKVAPGSPDTDARGDAIAALDDAAAVAVGLPAAYVALIFDYNDTHTHAEVLALFDAAIARLEREAAP